MSTAQRIRRGVFITLLFTAVTTPAYAAEPLTLFLLKMLRDQMISSALESAFTRQPQTTELPPAPTALTGVYGVNAEQVRGMIDTGFVHLTAAQRAEVYENLMRMLADPKNAQARPMIIQELALKAEAVRSAHERLAALTPAEKRAIAAEARAEFERLPSPSASRWRNCCARVWCRYRTTLNDLILAEFTAARTFAETSARPVTAVINRQSELAAFRIGGVLRNVRVSLRATSPQISAPSSILILP